MQRGRKLNRQLDMWVGTPLLNLVATFRRQRQPPPQITRLGVMCSPALGDTLLFSAALLDLRAAFPDAHIVHFCMKQNLAAAEIIEGADERVLISLTNPVQAIGRIRARQLDVLLDFTAWQRLTAFCTLMSGAKYTVGFRSAGQHRGRAFDCAVEHRRDWHELENFRVLVRESGLGVSATHEPAVIVPEGAAVLPDERDLVALHPWASGQSSWLREWPEERWIALARQLAGSDTCFVVTGGPSDRARTEPLVVRLQAAGLRAQPFVSPDGFVTLTRMLRRARLLVSVNTGVMHLGAVAGAATVSLNGPTAEHRWGARGPCVANVQPADGSGGYLHFGFEFDKQPAGIMESITVEQVVGAADALAARCGGQR